MRKIFIILFILLLPSFAQNCIAEKRDDPLEDTFYNAGADTPLERIENIVKLGVEKIEEGVKNTEPLTGIQTKQAVLEAKQEYLEEGLLRNSSRIDSHANLLKQVSITLEGATHAITNLKDRWNWWYTVLSSILTGVAGASVTWILKGRINKNENL